MAKMRLDRQQAKKIETYIRLSQEHMLWQKGQPKWNQTRRNGHIAPKRLSSNKRISDMPGLWGIVVAETAALAWQIAFALDKNDMIPESVGKVLCVNDDAFPANDEQVEDLFSCGIVLLFDQNSHFPIKPVCNSELITVPSQPLGYRAGYMYRDIVWNGEVPEEYKKRTDAMAKYDAYDKAWRTVVDLYRKTGASWYEGVSTAEGIAMMSYGFVSAEDIPKDPGRPASNLNGEPCVYSYEPKDYASFYEEAFKTTREVLEVWNAALEQNGIAVRRGNYDNKDGAAQLSRSIETGRALGFDSAMKAHFDGGVPIVDIFA